MLIDISNKEKTKQEIEQQGGWNRALYNQVRAGKLNKNEFTALQMYQAETERLRSKFMQDGVIDENEKRILQERADSTWNTYKGTGGLLENLKGSMIHTLTINTVISEKLLNIIIS